jgi:hypothetical protein
MGKIQKAEAPRMTRRFSMRDYEGVNRFSISDTYLSFHLDSRLRSGQRFNPLDAIICRAMQLPA